MKINLGAGPNWYKDGWCVLDAQPTPPCRTS